MRNQADNPNRHREAVSRILAGGGAQRNPRSDSQPESAATAARERFGLSEITVLIFEAALLEEFHVLFLKCLLAVV
jgi:hypothetical protein